MPRIVTVNGIDFTGNPCRVVTGSFNGRYLRAGERAPGSPRRSDRDRP